MCVRVSGLGVRDIIVADTGGGDGERIVDRRRTRAYVGDGPEGVRRVGAALDVVEGPSLLWFWEAVVHLAK